MTEPFTRQDISGIAKKLLVVCRGIETVDDLERAMIHNAVSGDVYGEHSKLELRPSNGGAMAHTISYMVPERGIPLEIRMNIPLVYTGVILKLDELLPQYELLLRDPFGNTIQHRNFPGAGMQRTKEILEELATYSESQS